MQPTNQIELLISNESPFGPNIHFAFDVSTKKLVYLAEDLQWILDDASVPASLNSLTKKISAEEASVLSKAYEQLLAGVYTGGTQLAIGNDTDGRTLSITPFLAKVGGELTVLGSVSDTTDETRKFDVVTKYANKKNAILQMLAHDLRGPLGLAKSLLKTMEQPEGDPLTLDKNRHIVGILEQSIGLINDLVTREFMDTSEIQLVPKRFDLVETLNEYLDECRKSAVLAQRTFKFVYDRDSMIVDLDDAKLMQIINNLLSNSLKFTTDSGHIRISLRETEDTVELEFADDGIGIPAALVPHVFDKFTSAARPGLHGEPTLGIGLSIVKLIANWMGGDIRCESEEGVGTTFYISFPRLQGER